MILRVLLALRVVLETNFWTDGRQYHQTAYGTNQIEPELQAQDEQEGLKVQNRILRTAINGRRPRWQVNPAAARATYELLIAGCGYLLYVSCSSCFSFFPFFLSIL